MTSTGSLPSLEDYQFHELLGSGATGDVYRGRQIALDRDVAIKVMSNAANDARYTREARLAAKVSSVNVVPVYDFKVLQDGRALLIMELVRGQSLAAVIREAPALPGMELARFMADAARGMIAIADAGIVHRDLKPANMLIDARQCLRVADFGIARLRLSADVELTRLTASGVIFGTPAYMAPEQAEDPHRADVRSDIYSYGATFYHAATGHVPFAAPGALAVLMKHKLEPLVSPRARRAELDPRISDVIERCMAKQPSDRFQAFDEVLVAVEEPSAQPWNNTDDPHTLRYLRQYFEQRARLLGEDSGDEGGLLMRITFAGGRVLDVVRGNLVKAEADAIVSSDDQSLTMGGGVSGALNAASGWMLHQEARIYERVRHGGVVVTGAGQLKAKFVFHAVTLDFMEHKTLEPSRDVILQLLDGCFYHAQTLMVRSLALPLLGTGAGGFAADVALDTIVTHLIKTLVHGAHGVERVILYLH